MAAKRAVIVGATGLVGRYLTAELAKKPDLEQIIALVRKAPDWAQDRSVEGVEWREIDFAKISAEAEAAHADVALCVLGTTQAKAGGKEAFAKVDRDYVVAFADGAQRGGADHFVMVSSVGADASSPSYYLKIKGQAERAIQGLDFERLDIFRPGLLMGSRNEFRLTEEIGKVVSPLLTPILPGPLSRFRGVDAISVARAMAASVDLSNDNGRFVHHNKDIEKAVANQAS